MTEQQQQHCTGGFPGGSVVKNPTTHARDAGDVGSLPGSGRSPGEGKGYPLQYSGLENLINRGTSRVVHGVTKSRTQLSAHARMIYSRTCVLALVEV